MRPKDKEKVGAIYQATVELSGERGLPGLTMNEIAKRAGIATGTLYIYFKNKEALVARTFEQLKEKSIALVMSQYDSRDPYLVMMKKLFIAYLKYCIDHQKELIFIEQVKHSAFIREVPDHLLTAFEEPINKLLNEGKQQLLIKETDNRILTAIIHGITHQSAILFTQGELELNQHNLDLVFFACWGAMKN